MAEALRELGCQRAMVVFGVDGIDELSTLGETLVMELEDGEITSWKLNAQRDLGIPIASLEEIAASDSAAENARIMMGVLDGSDKGARRDIVALNAAATLVVGGVAKCLNNGLEMAYKTLESGSAAALLEKLVKLTQE
jgi:anthranilate phosphoribosyltransferase